MPPLVLASRSPRRRELLEAAGYRFEVIPPACADEDSPRPGESPEQFVARLAWEKAADVAGRVHHGIVLGCDTIAECHGQLLGKPTSLANAERMLRLLSGQRHRVLTGLCLWPLPRGTPRTAVEVTLLRMDWLQPRQLAEYLASGQWQGKAGAFGYQDGPDWLHIVHGSESNVVGLPMERLAAMLAEIGYPPPPLSSPDISG